jgi:predicted nucleic acid-binding protein
VRSFLDTNILIYAQLVGAKANRARTLLGEGGILSVQVLNEFASVAHRKLGKSWTEIEIAIVDILALVDAPLPLTTALHTAARAIAADHGLAFYDALIVAAAQEAKCDALLTEDLQDGRVFSNLRIENPFAGLAG